MTKGYYGRSYEHGLNAKRIKTKSNYIETKLKWEKVPSVTTGGKSYFWFIQTSKGRFWIVWDRIYKQWIIKDGFDKLYGKFDDPKIALKEAEKIILGD